MLKVDKRYSVFLLFALLWCGESFSQQLNYTLNRDFLWGVDDYFNNKEQNFQTFIKPYRVCDINSIKDSSARVHGLLDGLKKNKQNDNKNKSTVELAPLLIAETGYQASSPSRLTSDLAIGGSLVCTLGKKISINFKALAGKATFDSHTDSVISKTQVIPGMGYAYRANTDSLNPIYAYQYYSGYLSYSPNKIFNVQIGQDKQFWGDGYRSLFLSDVSAPYPYMKITTNIWHLTYVNLYTIMKDVTNPSGFKSDWLNKYATFHYLGWNATKRINIGLFESVVWQGADSSRYRGYDVNYLNPVMFFRPTEYSLGSSDNALIGLSFKVKLFKKQQIYGQLMLDEFVLKEVMADIKHTYKNDSTSKSGWWANKQAFQIGWKSFDLFDIRNLNFQTEYNYVRPYTYSHGSVQQNYGHMDQPLAHPLGANFWEIANFINYRFAKRIFAEMKYVFAVYGADSAGTDYGNNIFISYTNRPADFGNFTTQGFQTKLTTASIRLAYLLAPDIGLKVELGFADRIVQTKYNTTQTPYLFIGLKTDLSNFYNDY